MQLVNYIWCMEIFYDLYVSRAGFIWRWPHFHGSLHSVKFLSSLQLLLQKAWHRDSDPAAAAVLANFLKTLYFRRWKNWMLHTLYMDASYVVYGCLMLRSFCQSHVKCPWPHFHGSVTTWKKVKIFCNVKFSLIISSRIAIFGMCIPRKVLMPVRQFSLDLNLISWISKQG